MCLYKYYRPGLFSEPEPKRNGTRSAFRFRNARNAGTHIFKNIRNDRNAGTHIFKNIRNGRNAGMQILKNVRNGRNAVPERVPPVPIPSYNFSSYIIFQVVTNLLFNFRTTGKSYPQTEVKHKRSEQCNTEPDFLYRSKLPVFSRLKIKIIGFRGFQWTDFDETWPQQSQTINVLLIEI